MIIMYILKIITSKKKQEEIHIFKIDDKDVVETKLEIRHISKIINGNVEKCKIITKTKELNIDSSKLSVREKSLDTLKDLSQRFLDNVYESKSDFFYYGCNFSNNFIKNSKE